MQKPRVHLPANYGDALGFVYLLGVVILPPFPSSPVSFPCESLDHVSRTTTVPVALLPLLRHRLGSSTGGGRLLSSENFHFYAYLRFVLLASLGLRWSSAGG